MNEDFIVIHYPIFSCLLSNAQPNIPSLHGSTVQLRKKKEELRQGEGQIGRGAGLLLYITGLNYFKNIADGFARSCSSRRRGQKQKTGESWFFRSHWFCPLNAQKDSYLLQRHQHTEASSTLGILSQWSDLILHQCSPVVLHQI